MIYVKFGVVLLGLFMLAGCGAVKKMGASAEYQHADSHDKILHLPKEMQTLKINDNYPMPASIAAKVATPVESNHSLILPPGSVLVK